MIVVIDGPAGSGKSSTAKAVARRLGIEYLDSGALYRALTVVYLETGKDPQTFFDLLHNQKVSFSYSDGTFRVFVNGNDLTGRLRSEKVSGMVSQIASMPEVRSYVNALMRDAVRYGSYIADGRDLGTVVFPDADLKYYMSADVDERARRRHEELQEQQDGISLEEVRVNILSRDQKDSQRKTDPLRKAEDAVEINTTNMTFEQQVDKICSEVSKMMEADNK